MTDISVIIPWCDREELGHTLRANSPYFRESAAEVLVVNCGGDERLLRRLLADGAAHPPRAVRVPARFNKSLAINVGAHEARGRHLMVLDADIVFRHNLPAELRAALAPSSFLTVADVAETEEGGEGGTYLKSTSSRREFVLADGRRVEVVTSRVRFPGRTRKGTGLLFLRREHFLAVGGMNSDLAGWGWEDNDIAARLQMALGLEPREAGGAVHLSHADDKRFMRDGLSRADNDELNFMACLARYERGLIQGTLEADVLRWHELVAAAPDGA
jgi:glycosyltransferase involved in cell wall biosynthesis